MSFSKYRCFLMLCAILCFAQGASAQELETIRLTTTTLDMNTQTIVVEAKTTYKNASRPPVEGTYAIDLAKLEMRANNITVPFDDRTEGAVMIPLCELIANYAHNVALAAKGDFMLVASISGEGNRESGFIFTVQTARKDFSNGDVYIINLKNSTVSVKGRDVQAAYKVFDGTIVENVFSTIQLYGAISVKWWLDKLHSERQSRPTATTFARPIAPYRQNPA